MLLNQTKEYPEFRMLLNALEKNNIDYERDLNSVMKNVNRRELGERFTLDEHIEGLVYALLSSQRPWGPIEKNRLKINNIFHDFDANYLKMVNPDDLVADIKRIKCGNRRISSQIRELKDNISTLEKIAEEYGSIDSFYDGKTAEELTELLSDQKSKYKLKGLGRSLAALYLKNMGILTEKPDIHTTRIIGLWGYSKNSPKPATKDETHEVCLKIAEAYGISVVEVDLIIWKGGESGVAYQ